MNRRIVVRPQRLVLDGTARLASPRRHVEEIGPSNLEPLAQHVAGQRQDGTGMLHRSFWISSAESDDNASAPSTSTGLCAVAMTVPSGRNSKITSTPAA